MKSIILKLIKIYQKTFSPDHGWLHAGIMRCRYWPSCSQYTYQAINKYGVTKGVLMGIYRILRCNPWARGGVDPVKGIEY